MSTETATPYEGAKAIAEELGAEWSAEEGETSWVREREAALVGPDGRRIRLQWNGGRVSATGTFPPELRDHTRDLVHIGFAADKPPAVAARDIKRRLLPRYSGQLTESWARKRQWDEVTAERDAMVDDAAAALAPLGEVRRSEHRGTLSAGRHDAPVRVNELGIDVRRTYPGAPAPEARVNVTVARELLPQLVRAIAALGESPGRDPAALSPQTIWLAWHTVDDMVGFETEERRDEYAAAVPGVEAGTLELLNDSAARQFIIDAAAEAAEEDDDCECSGEVVPGALPGFNGRNEIQACNTCNRYRDDEAAAAIAVAVGGEVVEHADDDPNRDPGGTWLTVVKDGEELTAERIREIAEASGDGDPGPCPKCGATTNQSWQNADDDRATCGECFEGYWMTTVDGDE